MLEVAGGILIAFMVLVFWPLVWRLALAGGMFGGALFFLFAMHRYTH